MYAFEITSAITGEPLMRGFGYDSFVDASCVALAACRAAWPQNARYRVVPASLLVKQIADAL